MMELQCKWTQFCLPSIYAWISYHSGMILLFLDLNSSLELKFKRNSIQSQKHFGIWHMSPHCQISDQGPLRLKIFSAQVGNRTPVHGDESNPVEINMWSAMICEPGLASFIGSVTPFLLCMIVLSPELVSSEYWTGSRAPSASYCPTEGVTTLHTKRIPC